MLAISNILEMRVSQNLAKLGGGGGGGGAQKMSGMERGENWSNWVAC